MEANHWVTPKLQLSQQIRYQLMTPITRPALQNGKDFQQLEVINERTYQIHHFLKLLKLLTCTIQIDPTEDDPQPKVKSPNKLHRLSCVALKTIIN